MDQQATSFLAAAAAAGSPSIAQMTPAAAREMFAGLAGFFLPARGDVTASDFVALPETGDAVACRLYRPPTDADSKTGAEAPLPVVFYFHGGGWVVGSVETHDTLCQHLCYHSGAIVISVDYRLAPEYPFPTAEEDCYRALDYVFRRADEFGIDPARVAVAGDSAGGNLAAATSRTARDFRAKSADAPPIVFQALIYPVTDARCNTRSYNDFAQDFGLTREEMRHFWKCYCSGERAHEAAASPLQHADLAGLPDTWILTAEFDVLRDEGERYASNLKVAGVKADMERWRGQIHGFFHLAGYFDEGRRAVMRAATKLQTALRAHQ